MLKLKPEGAYWKDSSFTQEFNNRYLTGEGFLDYVSVVYFECNTDENFEDFITQTYDWPNQFCFEQLCEDDELRDDEE